MTEDGQGYRLDILYIGSVLSVYCGMALRSQNQILGSTGPCAPGQVVVHFGRGEGSTRPGFAGKPDCILQHMVGDGNRPDQLLKRNDLFCPQYLIQLPN